MDLRILMIGDDPCNVLPDIQLLRDKGVRVYTIFNHENIADIQKEIKPHIIFFNAQGKNIATGLLEKEPGTTHHTEHQSAVIYTIRKNDSYMIVQYMPDINRKKVVLANDLVTAIKTALNNIMYTPKLSFHNSATAMHLHTVGV